MKPIILVLGMPGSGKTMIGQELAKHLLLPFRSVGDILREGKRLGVLPRTDPAIELLSLTLQRTPELFSRGLVLDYSPVTTDGEEHLNELLHRQSFVISFVIYVRTRLRDAENRFIKRGQRVDDPGTEQFFRQRIVEQFWPFTLSMVRQAYKRQNLLILDNRQEGVCYKNECQRILKLITEHLRV